MGGTCFSNTLKLKNELLIKKKKNLKIKKKLLIDNVVTFNVMFFIGL